MSDRLTSQREVHWLSQTFHVLPTTPKGRAATLFRADRKAISLVLDTIQPDVVHGWGSEDVYGLAAVCSAFPAMVSMQGILSHYALKNRLPARAYLQAILEFYILHKAEMITTESAWGRSVVLRRNPRAHVALVEYGVQEHFLNMTWMPDPARPIAVFVGSVSPRKGIQDAVEAFRAPELAHAELYVLGECNSRWAKKLRSSAPANVRWLGHVSSNVAAERLCQAWCLVLPTRADTSPNVVKEARVIGLPAVTTPCGGQATYIIESETGFLVQPGNVAGLRARLIQLTHDFALCRKMGACHHDAQRFALHPARTAEGFIALYRTLISSRNGRVPDKNRNTGILG